MAISHEEQKKKWNEEHANPLVLKQMDARKASSSLNLLIEFLEREGLSGLIGLEMGCGKGRNAIWLAEQTQFSKVYGFDFSEVAIEEAHVRAKEAGVSQNTQFDVMDATLPWKYDDNFFDVGIDWTASTDIETPEGREKAVGEMRRVLKPGGIFLVYVMSTDDEYHKKLIAESPAEEKDALIRPETGKFEKVFTAEELDGMYKDFELIDSRRISKTTEFFGKEYACLLHWRLYRKN